MSTRYKVERGSLATLTATFDTSALPSGSLNNLNIEWYVQRTLTQGYQDIVKATYSGSVAVINPGPPDGIVNVYLTPSDTIPMVPGTYYWSFRLFDPTGTVVDALSPTDRTGDLIILNSARYL
jgi:hypothetical protein